MSLRKKKWEKWKQEELKACPPRKRKECKRILDSMTMPTVEDERRLEEATRVVKSALKAMKKKMTEHGKK